MSKSRVFIIGKRKKDSPTPPQMTQEKMNECVKNTKKYFKQQYRRIEKKHGSGNCREIQKG